MKQFDLSEYNSQTKIYLCLMSLVSAAALVFAVFDCFSFSVSQWMVLIISLGISAVANLESVNIPRTRATFPAREIIAFWGIIWLGLPGGVLLAASSSIAKRSSFGKNRKQWLFDSLVSIASVAAAALVFRLFLEYVGGVKEMPVAEKEVGYLWLTTAILLLAGTHYIVNALNAVVSPKSETNYSALGSRKKDTVSEAVKYFVMFSGTLLAYFSFLQFGIWFGLVVLPLVVIAHLAYRMHLQSLAYKTRQTTEANRIHVATVEALATAIDARDQVGIGHVRRTQIYAVGIGRVLELSPEEIEALRTGALLHDIGKLAVPDHILNKPGRLTPAEQEKMKIHSTVGASILEKVHFPYPVVPTVKYHHEMWDGTGYPEGLKKEDIPLTARILAIADAYDTLRGARPYRGAISRDEARRIMLNGAGARFDPRITDTFLRNLREFEDEINAQGLSYTLDGESEEELFNGLESNSTDVNQGYVAQIKRANREVFALYELARVFSSSLNLDESLNLFVSKISELVPFDSCVVYLLDKTQESATGVYVEGKNANELRNRLVKTGSGATGYALKKRQPVYNINPALDFSFYQADFIQEYTAMASIPLITEEKLVGAVSLYSCELENYEDEHMRLLETISRIGADAIYKSMQHADAESRALTDPMTNLPNARSLQLQFETEVARARRTNSQFQVLMLDLDGFKAVNDTFGHKTGDMLLREVAKVMRAQLRDYDFLARYAGDEFVVIAPETNEIDVQELCERLEKAVLGFSLKTEDGRPAKVGVSLGAAGYPQAGESLDQIIIAADKQMYEVKAKHKEKQKIVSAQAEKIKEISAANTIETEEDMFIVELDESHIISSAIN